MRHIDITFDADGNPSIALDGYTGKECVTATETLEHNLGLHSSTKTLTPDAHRAIRKESNVRTA